MRPATALGGGALGLEIGGLEIGVRFQLIREPPAMEAHFSALSLKKWPLGRAALLIGI